jgi:hypothetical protein
MWIILNPISHLILAIYPQAMLVSAKKKPWMFEIFSIYHRTLNAVDIKAI